MRERLAYFRLHLAQQGEARKIRSEFEKMKGGICVFLVPAQKESL